jgi:anti-anti-sigma regulatory factor
MTSPLLVAPSGHTVVRAPQQLTLVHVPTAIADLEEALAVSPWLVVDMDATEALDATGLRVLTWARERARRECGEVVLSGLRPGLLAATELAFVLGWFASYPCLTDVPPVPAHAAGPG